MKVKQQPERTPMNLREYWNIVGTDNMLKIIEQVGSSRAYFRLMKYGFKRPGAELALAIVKAARELTPGFEPDIELLLQGVPRANRPSKYGTKTPPSPEFLKAQAKLAKSEGVAA